MDLCLHCHKYLGDHAGEACLFMPTVFRAMTPEELDAFISRAIDRKYPQFKPTGPRSP